MPTKIFISVLNGKANNFNSRPVAARVPLSVYDVIENIARKTNRTRSDVVKIMLMQGIRLIEITDLGESE